MNLQAHTMNLSGTSYEIGQQLGEIAASVPPLKSLHTTGMANFDTAAVTEAIKLFEQWCPGLEAELAGFADTLGVAPEMITYYGMTSLRPRPRCSQLAISPSMSADGRPLLARSYEFNHEMEDFSLVRTDIEGKYTHLGTSVMQFGRDDGFNECGLAVTMSSCGFPVGPQPFMRAPVVKGLQFWAVVRSVLENCKDVDEALDLVKDIPIAYNINMMVMDKAGHIALVETYDGQQAVKRIDPEDEIGYLCATNHIVIPEFVHLEPKAMRHSLIRHQWITEQMSAANTVTPDLLKDILLSEFPNGLTCHFFKDFLGTTKSMVFDPCRSTIDLCWGGEAQNGWRSYDIHQLLPSDTQEIRIRFEEFDPVLAEYLPLELS